MALTVCSQHSNIRKDEVPEEPENKTLDATGMLLWKWGWGCSCRGSGRCLEQQQHLRRRAWASSCDRLNEHLTVCVCVWDSVLYVSQWIVFNVARLKLPAWTSFSASPLCFLFFSNHYLFIEDPVSAALSFSRNRSFHPDHNNTSWQSNLVAGITWKWMKIPLAELLSQINLFSNRVLKLTNGVK